MRSRPSEHPGPTRLPWEVLPQLPAVSVFHFVQVSDKTTIQKTKKSMKKTKILSLVSLGAFLLTTSGCTDYDFDSKYEDPSKVTQVTISNLMVGVFQKVKDYDVYEYNRFFGFDSQFTGKYAQTFGYSNTTDMYTPGYIPLLTDSGTMCIRHWPSSVSWNLSTRKKARQNKPRTRHSILPPKYSCTISLPPQWTFSGICLSRKLVRCRLPTM
mgnify:FL=1